MIICNFSIDDKAKHIFHIQLQTAIPFPHPASVGPLKRKVKKAEGFLEKKKKVRPPSVAHVGKRVKKEIWDDYDDDRSQPQPCRERLVGGICPLPKYSSGASEATIGKEEEDSNGLAQ